MAKENKLEVLGVDKITVEDMREGTAVMFLRMNDQLYAMGAEGLGALNDRDLYNALVRLKNLTASAQRTLYYAVANRKGELLHEFMAKIEKEQGDEEA